MITATRRLQFCAGHRVFKHESKCANMHGHNYVLEITARTIAEFLPLSGPLDDIGRVIDFSEMKEKMGAWIEENWDHGFLWFAKDTQMADLFTGPLVGHKNFRLPCNPTAELLADFLLRYVSPELFSKTGVEIIKIVLHETENCKVEVSLPEVKEE